MNLYNVKFEGKNPVGCCLIIKAKTIRDAHKIASETITHTTEFEIEKVNMMHSGVVIYLSGDY